jgi:hypothetical protein
MDPISNTDRLLAILRHRLQERSRDIKRRAGEDRKVDGNAEPATGLDAIALLSDVDLPQLRRACIQALLADQFGANLLNDAPFQQIVTRVTDAMSGDQKTAELLDRIIQDVRSS